MRGGPKPISDWALANMPFVTISPILSPLVRCLHQVASHNGAADNGDSIIAASPWTSDAGPPTRFTAATATSQSCFDIRRALAVYSRDLTRSLRTILLAGRAIPTRPEPAVVLGPIKKWPEIKRLVGTNHATAILDLALRATSFLEILRVWTRMASGAQNKRILPLIGTARKGLASSRSYILFRMDPNGTCGLHCGRRPESLHKERA